MQAPFLKEFRRLDPRKGKETSNQATPPLYLHRERGSCDPGGQGNYVDIVTMYNETQEIPKKLGDNEVYYAYKDYG